MKATNPTLRIFLIIFGFLFCILPPLCAVLCYFPLWKERGAEAVVSGFAVLLIALCFTPFFKAVKRILSSPASYTVWFIIFITFFLLSRIAEEMIVISFFGFIGNLLGALLFRLSGIKRGAIGNEKQL